MKMIAALTLVIVAAACGGSPTQPTPTATTVAQATTPAPEPVPEPIPPTPAPVPPPTPTPRNTFEAVTSFSHWYHDGLSDRFDVRLEGSTVTFGTYRADAALFTSESFLLVENGQFTIEAHQEGSNPDVWIWSFNGLDGQASGVMYRKVL